MIRYLLRFYAAVLLDDDPILADIEKIEDERDLRFVYRILRHVRRTGRLTPIQRTALMRLALARPSARAQ